MSFFLFFLSFSLSLNWERGGEYIIGYREKQSYSLLIFSDGFLWRIFSLLRADGLYVIFSSGLKVRVLPLVQDSFRFLYPESGHETRVLSRRPHLQKLIFLFPISTDGRRGLFPLWDSSQLFGFYLLPSPVRWFEWGHGVQIAWPTFFSSFNGRPKLTYILYLSFNGQSLANSNTESCGNSLFLFSQWETMWHHLSPLRNIVKEIIVLVCWRSNVLRWPDKLQQHVLEGWKEKKKGLVWFGLMAYWPLQVI